MHHPNVVSFYGVVRDGEDGSLATVTEFMINGSLKQFLQKKDRLFSVIGQRICNPDYWYVMFMILFFGQNNWQTQKSNNSNGCCIWYGVLTRKEYRSFWLKMWESAGKYERPSSSSLQGKFSHWIRTFEFMWQFIYYMIRCGSRSKLKLEKIIYS